jgi:uncharacterized protein (TIGR01777 family)
MDVVVSGASGLIGTALCRSLRADGHRVIELVRRPPASGTTDEVEWDPKGGRLDPAALEGVDAVVHLAGAGIGDKRWSEARKQEVLESRTRSTALLAETLASLQAKPSVVVSGSAIGYYGHRGDDVVTEATPPGGGFVSQVCVEWEAAAQAAVDAGIRTVFIRTGIVLAPKGGAFGKLVPLFKLGLGGKMGGGREWWSWISLDDEVRAIRFLIDKPVHGPVNLTAPNPARNAEITRALGEVLHRPTFLTVPAFGPKLLLGSELADSLLFMSQRIEPTVLLEHGFEFNHPGITAALRDVLGRA